MDAGLAAWATSSLHPTQRAERRQGTTTTRRISLPSKMRTMSTPYQAWATKQTPSSTDLHSSHRRGQGFDSPQLHSKSRRRKPAGFVVSGPEKALGNCVETGGNLLPSKVRSRISSPSQYRKLLGYLFRGTLGKHPGSSSGPASPIGRSKRACWELVGERGQLKLASQLRYRRVSCIVSLDG